ncbi:WD40-repeat-containing domain protein [Actinidia chinensis var. chinensis]|uniref:WD40-repeat-containing domain protein n=2 Tax=Actinidia chinensis var. chinensis TaxID=1590841 RepID=A0A2R6QZZ7_ACTCC|nr:WD40-repeat-containing domain protein [Actinidia chinensis var. chinensis]
MASLDSTNSPPGPSFAIRGPQTNNLFLRSISAKDHPNSGSDFNSFSPLHHSSSQPSTPRLAPSPLLNPTTTARCVASVLKKDGQILSVAASNGLVYTGSETNVVRVWKLPEFTECDQLKTKAGTVVALEVSNDKVYAAYADFKIRVWRRTWEGVTKHVRLATIPRAGSYVRSYIAGKDKMMRHMGPISSLAINVSDEILYSASFDKTVKVWRISDHKCIETIQAHSEPINAIVVADDGVLYTASDDATVRVWRRNFCSGDRAHSLTVTLPAKYSPVKALTLSCDGGVLYGGCTDGYIHYWHRGWFSGQLQHGGELQGHTHAVMCLASVGNYVVSGSADSTSRVWVREPDGQYSCVAVLQGHRGPIRCVAAFHGSAAEESEDGCTVCTGSIDGVLKVWRVVNNAARCPAQKSCEYFELN